MTGRQTTLLRYSAAVLVLAVVITVAVVWVERARDGDTDSGVVDVLARGLPEDAPVNRFTDATARAGITVRHFPATRSRVLPEDMGSGLAWGDCNGDGFDDLYVVNFPAPLGTPADELASLSGNVLYRNRGDGTFEDVSAAAGVDLTAFGMGAAWGDYDGDGDADLYVTNYGRNVLYRNDGSCAFTDVTGEAGIAGGDDFSAGAVWGDYDSDGQLDLYVTNYVVFDEARQPQGTPAMQYGTVVPFTLNPASYQPAANWLFRNDGDGGFTEVAAAAGVANAAGRSLSAAWADWDADGDVDLYVANDISDNAFFRNRGDGSFEDISTLSLTADYRGAMGLAIGDYDRDADLDFFVTHWIAQENALYENHMSADAPAGEPLLFTDVADYVGLGAPGLDHVGWGTGFIDFDNDGFQDLFVVNGHTLEDEADPTRLLPQRMQLFWNRGEEGFFELSEVAGPPFERLLVARGAAASDYDRDGDVDIAVLAHGAGVLLLNNAGTPGAHWIELDLRQQGANRRAVGAAIRVETDDGSQMTTVGGAASYLSQHSLTAHFGLGDHDAVARVVVRWPDGTEEAFAGLAADARHELVRGGGGDPAAVAAVAGSEEDFWNAYRAGTEARRLGRAASAIEAYERALTIRPAHPDTLHNLAQLRYARGEIRPAWALLERLAAADPRGNRAWQQLSRVAGTPVAGWSIDLDAADAMIDRALEVHPGNSESHLLGARWKAYRGDRPGARAGIEAALGLNPRGAEAYLLALWMAIDSGDQVEAERIKRQAVVAMCGDEPAGRDCLGSALLAAISTYWDERASPRPVARLDGPGGSVAVAETMPLSAPVDLDGDGSADVRVNAHGPFQPVRFTAVDDGGAHLPAATLTGWGAEVSTSGPRPVPWRGLFLEDRYGSALVLAGGGDRAVRLYGPDGDVWRERAVAGWPRRVARPVITAADWDVDGGADLFIGNVLDDANAEASTRAADAELGSAMAESVSDSVGIIYRRRGADEFVAHTLVTRELLGAALALDADDDGDADLLTARALPSRETAVARLLEPAVGGAAAQAGGVLSLWRNDGGRLHRDPDAVPGFYALVQDLAVVGDVRRGGGFPDLWVATGGLAPERVEPDLLLVNREGRLIDQSAVLAGSLRWGRTLRAWSRPSGGLLLLRGGMTPADAVWFATLPPMPGDRAPRAVAPLVSNEGRALFLRAHPIERGDRR